MGKYCKAYGYKVTYLDCMECETKECRKQTNASMEGQQNKMIAKYVQNMEDVNLQEYLKLIPEQQVYLVFGSRKEGYKENVIIKCKVKECSVRNNGTLYFLETVKCVTKNLDLRKTKKVFMCTNKNIDTGYRGLRTDLYPVFTDKQKCIKWLKEE